MLDEDPAVLIRECIGNFNIAPDRSSLTRIQSDLGKLAKSRKARLASTTTDMKKTARQLNSMQQQHDLAVSAHDPTEHARSIFALDAQKFRLAKEASAAEIESERLEGELRGCENLVQELERSGTEGRKRGSVGRASMSVDTDEQMILKLKLYRSLGIDIEPDTNGEYRRAVVRNPNKHTAAVVEIDPSAARSAYTDQIWKAL